MPLYSELVRIEGEYNYSANIQFDMENDKKLFRFIPNETTIELIREYFIDITKDSPTHHSRILYGSYGTGKSHFLTVLGMLLSKTYTNGMAYKTFLSRVSLYDDNLAQDINAYISDPSRKPLLVVPIVFDFDDFDRCIYFSLKKRLETIGKKVSFKTFYDQAAQLINQWKSSKESSARLIEACRKSKVELQDLEEMLRLFDKKAEGKFQKVFSEMTYGVKYIYEVSNLSENINQANEALGNEYSGIVFIFDEFGRYIEDNIKSIKVKAVQDLAEFCDHSSGNNHVILVSHKEISQYTQKYGKTIANEWKKVEGRYKATPINNRQDQCLSLIKNILIKDDVVWSEYRQKYEKELNRMYSEAFDFRGFLIDAAQGENPFEGGFPLHPISLFALDKLSKRVAQNERTFFTYLASKDDNSLYRFLNNHDLEEFHFVGIDEIYDYFEPNIKATQSDASFEWYRELQAAFSKNHSSSNDNSPEAKILKVIAAIGIINDPGTLNANKSTILSVIDCPKEVLANALEGLCEAKIIKYSGAYDRYDFFEASIFDVEDMIENESQSVSDEAIVNALNDEFISFALYPYDYNRTYKITRVFLPVFATIQDAQKKTFTNRFGKYYDGLLVMLLADPDFRVENAIEVSNAINRSIVFANTDTTELKKSVQKYIAVKYLESQKGKYTSADPAFEKELAYFKEELFITVSANIQKWKNSFDCSVILAANGNAVDDVCSFSELSNIASNIMLENYANTLIVNNELINKNFISGSITTAKKNVVLNIIKGESPNQYYGVPVLSPDYIAVRSVLVKNGFIVLDDEIQTNALADGRQPQTELQQLLENFVVRGKTESINFNEIYSALKEPPFGLRNGYLSLLLAHVLMPYKKSLIISSHGTEQEITVDLFEEIIRRPHDYSFTIADWDSNQIDYLDALEQIFADYINETSLSKNRLKAIYDGMMSHYKNVSKFARTTKLYVSPKTKEYRDLLGKSVTNYSIFLLSDLLRLGADYLSCIDNIKEIKAELDDALNALSRELVTALCSEFQSSSEMALGKVICEKYEHSWKAKRSKSFDYYTNSFLELVSKVGVNESDYDIVLKMSKALTGFELLYWNDSHKNEFLNKVKEILSKLDSYQEASALSETETKMVMVASNGEEKSIVFDRSELSGLGKTVRNKIQATFSNYGLSVTNDDKVQILLSLLEDLMEGK